MFTMIEMNENEQNTASKIIGKRFSFTDTFVPEDNRSYIVEDVHLNSRRDFVICGNNGSQIVLPWQAAGYVVSRGSFSFYYGGDKRYQVTYQIAQA